VLDIVDTLVDAVAEEVVDLGMGVVGLIASGLRFVMRPPALPFRFDCTVEDEAAGVVGHGSRPGGDRAYRIRRSGVPV
jgi:hypothetical protein